MPESTQTTNLSRRLPHVKNVVAVGSGKGGVGKSTVAVNLALALKKEGQAAGLLDADIYGPSIPIMCGVKEGEKPRIAEGNRILPLERFGLPLMSMGFLMGEGDAVVWRGPMLAKMLQQFLEQVEWGRLDYLIVDLPPGTGDVQLTLAQLIPLTGAVVVTTPQDVAFADVRRAIKMFQMTQVPILGIVENMGSFSCPHCHKESSIFGQDENHSRYRTLDLRLLGELPLEIETRLAGDQGTPIVERDPKSKQAERFRQIAHKLIESQKERQDFELPSF
ncbi:MAG: Mrp/NBP35 family ATP-binding protein [Deltaproteobacteria bacterium]|nr:Mrp/NBP35 family ATP-binding protein [Deltaproteobacteria bacterium]